MKIKYMRGIFGESPFKRYKIYGPILDKSDKRNRVVLTLRKPFRTFSMPYSRYLMSIKLGRRLKIYEEVDHKNNNRSDDRIANLQILSHKDNMNKMYHALNKTRTKLKLRCPVCKTIFIRDIWHTHLSTANKSKTTCCSRRCGASNKRFCTKGNILKIFRI